MTIGARLCTAYPDAMECSTGRPDPALLPLDIIGRAWDTAMRDVTPRDLQYARPEPIPALRNQLRKRLASDGVPVADDMMLICDSAQQAFTLTMELLAERFPHAQSKIAGTTVLNIVDEHRSNEFGYMHPDQAPGRSSPIPLKHWVDSNESIFRHRIFELVGDPPQQFSQRRPSLAGMWL